MGLKEIFAPPVHNPLPEEYVFTSLDEVPDDVLPLGYEDGDNSLLENYYKTGLPMTGMELAAESQRNAEANLLLMLNRQVIVPLPRELKLKTPYMVGQDVLALQRALAHAKVRKWGRFTTAFGRGTKKNVAEFQERKGLTTDGVYGLETHKKLAPHYDAYGTFLMNKVNKKIAVTPQATIVAYATFGYNQRYKIHYTQGPLRMYGVRNKVRPPRIPFYEDCSSFSTWCYWGAGMRDPNGLGYNGWGYTGTLAQHGSRTSSPKAGDLAFYGRYPYKHVVVYIGNNRCVSHGSERGPVLSNVYYRSDFSHFRTY